MAEVLLAGEARRGLLRLSIVYRRAVVRALEELAAEPLRGKPLRGRLRHLRSLRVGVYRVLYRFGGSGEPVIVEVIQHRSEAYRDAR